MKFKRFFFAFSVLFSALLFSPLVAQEESIDEIMAKARKRQAEMMKTQFFMQQLSQLSFNSELKKELEIIDSQVEDVKKLATDYQKAMMEFHRTNGMMGFEIQKLHKEGKAEEAAKLGESYQEKQRSFNQEYRDKAAETLLPHQLERLEQISRQQQARFSNEFHDEFGIAASLADDIGLSSEQKDKLVEKIKEARKEYYEKVEAAKQEANDKILSALTPEQQQKIKDLLGDTWDQEKTRRRSMQDMMKKQKEMSEKRKQKLQEQIRERLSGDNN